jgi:hypothetical protein
MHRLAVAMRDPHVGRRISARDFAQWMWAEEIEPFGEKREDYRAAQIVAMIYNMAVAAEDRKPVEEFLLQFSPKDEALKPRQSVKDQIMILNILAAMSVGQEA